MQYSTELGPVMKGENSAWHRNQSEQEKHIMKDVTVQSCNQQIAVLWRLITHEVNRLFESEAFRSLI